MSQVKESRITERSSVDDVQGFLRRRAGERRSRARDVELARGPSVVNRESAGHTLTKAQVEMLMGAVDTDRFVEVIGSCLVQVLGRVTGWDDLIDLASAFGGWSAERVRRLKDQDVDALYDVATELNEYRTLVSGRS